MRHVREPCPCQLIRGFIFLQNQDFSLLLFHVAFQLKYPRISGMQQNQSNNNTANALKPTISVLQHHTCRGTINREILLELPIIQSTRLRHVQINLKDRKFNSTRGLTK